MAGSNQNPNAKGIAATGHMVRISKELYAKLLDSSEAHNRSVTAEIDLRLRESFSPSAQKEEPLKVLADRIEDLDVNIRQLVRRMGGKTLG